MHHLTITSPAATYSHLLVHMLGGIPLDTVKNEREEVIDLFEFPDL